MRIFALICVLLGGMGQGVVAPKLPELLHDPERLALDSGISATLMYLGIFISTYYYGRKADQGKAHVLLTGGLGVYALVLAGLAVWAQSNLAIYALRFIEGLALSAVFVSADFALGRLSKPSERGRWLSFYGVALSAGLLLGPALSLGIARVFGPSPSLPLGVVAFAALALSGLAIRFRVPRVYESPAAPIRLARAPLMVGSAYGFLEAGLVAVFPVLALSYFHLQAEALLIVVILSAAASSFFWGWSADQLGSRKISLLLLLLLGAGCLLLMRANAYLLCVYFGALAGGLYPVGFNWLLEGLPESVYGHASGSFARAYGLGSLVGPFACGAAVQWGSLSAFLGILSALGFSAAFFAWSATKRPS